MAKRSKKKKLQNQKYQKSPAPENPREKPQTAAGLALSADRKQKEGPALRAVSKSERPFESWNQERNRKTEPFSLHPLNAITVKPEFTPLSIQQQKQLHDEYASRPHLARISSPRLKEAAIQAEMDLDWLKIPYGEISQITVNDQFHTLYGRAKGKRAPGSYKPSALYNKRHNEADGLYYVVHNAGARQPAAVMWEAHPYTYKIEISPMLLKEDVPMDSLYATLMHEYLHTAPDCQNHGASWQNYAYICSGALGIQISRTTDSSQIGVADQMEESARFVLECQNCHKKTYRFRTSNLVQHPEQYRCSCGGKLNLIKGAGHLPSASSSPSSSSSSASARSSLPYAVQCERCGKVFGRQRMSKIIQYPELYRCQCGGKLRRIR